MRYRTDIDRILGPDILPKLFEFIEKGTINKSNLKNMAHNMGVTVTFDNHKDDDAFDGRTTLSEMLDKEMLKLIYYQVRFWVLIFASENFKKILFYFLIMYIINYQHHTIKWFEINLFKHERDGLKELLKVLQNSLCVPLVVSFVEDEIEQV